MNDYFKEAEYILYDLQFDYLGGRYRGRGVMTWKPEQGFHIEAPLLKIPVMEKVQFGKVRIIRKSDTSSIRMLTKNYYRAIAPTVIFLDRDDVISEHRLSIKLERVIFLHKYRFDLTKSDNLVGSALYETKNIDLLFDNVARQEKINIKGQELFGNSLYHHRGIYYEGEQGEIIKGYMIDDKYLKIDWSLPREYFTKQYSWNLAEAIQYSLSIILGQKISLLQRVAEFRNQKRVENIRKQPINSLNLFSLLDSRDERRKNYFVRLTEFFAKNESGSDICRNILLQLVEASRQSNRQVRELLIATILEAALRNIDRKPFEDKNQPKKSNWTVGTSLKNFINQHFSDEWKNVPKDVMKAHTYLRDRNAHPDWLFTQGGALSEEEQEKSLDSMIFLSAFYGYMILALAGVKDLKPLFPQPHSQWGPVITIIPANPFR